MSKSDERERMGRTDDGEPEVEAHRVARSDDDGPSTDANRISRADDEPETEAHRFV